MNELSVADIENFNSQVGKTYYVLCPDNEKYYRSVYVRYNPFTQALQPHISNPVYGVPPAELEPISPLQLSRSMRTQIQSTYRRTLSKLNTMKKPQKTLHISFTQDTEDMYFELMRQSSRTLVPVSPLGRYYMNYGMKHAPKPQLV